MIKACIAFLLPLLFFTCNSDDTTPGKTDSLPVTPKVVFNPESCRDTIAKLETLRSGLIIRGHGDSLLEMYTDDAQILGQYQTIFSGKSSIVTYWSMQNIYTQYDRTIVSLKGNENLLYETGIEAIRGHARNGDQEFAGSDKYLVIWKRDDGKWKIASEMWNELPATKTDDGD